jgi:ATP-dependent DNA helicase PIF1
VTKKQDLGLSQEQQSALDLLLSGENVFLSGGAGSGKSYLIRAFMQKVSSAEMPILASTGAAAVLLGGRTFHSFFGLGIMEGGAEAAYDKATRDQRTMKRIAKVEGFVLDEISMIPGVAFETAEKIARAARGSSLPWGGMRIIVVGDFAQLPPVTRTGARDWAFQTRLWKESGFSNCMLTHNHRVEDRDFLDVLADVRVGQVTSQVKDFLESRLCENDPGDDSTRLFPRRDQSEIFNKSELAKIDSKQYVIDSIFIGEQRFVDILKKSAPVPEQLVLKKGCQVMFIQNDPQKRWVNGTRGIIVDIETDKITVEKRFENRSGRDVTVEKSMFSMLDAEGNAKASVINFPLTLAYATTIHKSQGATMDRLWVDLSRLWEPGHAYVAMSRLRQGTGLRLLSYTPRSFLVDPKVLEFYQSL